jgi:hypothetical protein
MGEWCSPKYSSTPKATTKEREGVAMKRFIGVDLHKNSFTVCYMQKNGECDLKAFSRRKRAVARR